VLITNSFGKFMVNLLLKY